jgi:hypothetical protein
MRTRPGLVLFGDDSCLAQLGVGPEDDCTRLILTRLHELFSTTSRLGVRDRGHLERIKVCLPEFAGQVIELSSDGSNDSTAANTILRDELDRCAVELHRGPGRRHRRLVPGGQGSGATPHSLRSSFHDDEVTSRSR